MTNKKKGVVLVYNPHNLHQFLWYYCTYGKEYSWTAISLPNGYKGEYMSSYCEKSGIFEKVIKSSLNFQTMSAKEKLPFFIKMCLYAITGKQRKYYKKFIEQFIPYDDYDIAVVLTDIGIVSGMFIGAGYEKKTVIMEDGTGDYAARPDYYILKRLGNFHDWQGFLTAKMGYSNPAHYYKLKTTRYCEKFSSNPEKMQYRDYKSINRLFDMSDTDEVLFQDINKKIYEEIVSCDFEKAEAVVFTNRFQDFTRDAEIYIEKFQDYINRNYKSIIIKRHPRDETNYVFHSDVTVQEIDNSVPAEVILPYIKEKKIVFMFTSSIMLYMNSYHYTSTFLYFEGLYEKSREADFPLKYITRQAMEKNIKEFHVENSTIIDL